MVFSIVCSNFKLIELTLSFFHSIVDYCIIFSPAIIVSSSMIGFNFSLAEIFFS